MGKKGGKKQHHPSNQAGGKKQHHPQQHHGGKKQQKKKTQKKVAQATFGVVFWVVCLLTSVLIIAAVATHGRLLSTLENFDVKLDFLDTTRHPNKPFHDQPSFFPFYMSEHSDKTCRLLHFIGTNLSVLTMLYLDPKILLSVACAVSIGLIMCELTVSLPHGAVEGALLVATYFSLNKLLIGRLGWEPLIVGYAFAWVGHFFFEENKPATFIYPAYSFISDFIMDKEILLGNIEIV